MPTSGTPQWLVDVDVADARPDGLVRTVDYDPTTRPATEVALMERATAYGAHAVFFEAADDGGNGAAQAFVFVTNGGLEADTEFAELHQRLWSWGGVPLAYRRSPGVVQLFRCAHKPDFAHRGRLVCRPHDTLSIGADVSAAEAWWDAAMIRNGTLWDDPETAGKLLSADESAHRRLVVAVGRLHEQLGAGGVLSPHLRRRLLILSLLIAYLDQREALPEGFFADCLSGAGTLAEVLANGPALQKMLGRLKELFNGDVFEIGKADHDEIAASTELDRFSSFIEARQEPSGQMTLWALYSFRDLPVEVISHVYELFVTDPSVSVYTPPALVRLVLDEVLDDARLDRIVDGYEVVLDPSCGSGVFLVEAFKKTVLRWRARNSWAQPEPETLRDLLRRMHGIDCEAGAIELAAFSLCVAMCDALTSEQIRNTSELFPKLRDHGLVHSCFFEAGEKKLLSERVGVVVGNPPFKSELETPGARRAYDRYLKEHGHLPDLQVAYLFLHEAMNKLVPGGVLGMLQQYNLLYNEKPGFRRRFLSRWNVREVLDFVSVRGLFTKDTKVVVVVAVAEPAPEDGSVLHAVFRRTARADANQRFDIDHYDLHRIPRRALAVDDTPDPWRSNLLGGARTYALVKRLRAMPTLEAHARRMKWDFGEGFIEGKRGVERDAEHLYGKPLLPSAALTDHGIDERRLKLVERKPIEGPRTAARFTAPLLLIREHGNLPNVLLSNGYLTYKNKIVGFAARDVRELEPVSRWLQAEMQTLRAYAAAISLRMLHQKATTLSCRDIYDLPYDPEGTLDLSPNEKIVAVDLVDHWLDFVRLGSGSDLAKTSGREAVGEFARIVCAQIGAVYRKTPLRPAGHALLSGTICQAFVFGDGEVDWSGAQDLRGRLNALLTEHRGTSLSVTRIARVYDGAFVFLLKPDRLRYWLPSTALCDADDVLADMRAQGY